MIDKMIDINVLAPCIVTGVAFKKYYSSIELVQKTTEFIEEMPNIHVDNHYTIETENGLTCVVLFDTRCEFPTNTLQAILLDASYACLKRRCEYQLYKSISDLDKCVRTLRLKPEMILGVGVSKDNNELFVMIRFDAPMAVCEYGEPCDPDILSMSCIDITQQYRKYMEEVLLK